MSDHRNGEDGRPDESDAHVTDLDEVDPIDGTDEDDQPVDNPSG